MQDTEGTHQGIIEYNSEQSFALQVYWVVRSPTAASEMMQRGFHPCGLSTMRDTPATLAYIFRISRDQRLASKMKEEVKTISQHPHYQTSFKSLQMGIPQPALAGKLKGAGFDVSPLSWNPDEPIAGHEKELDFEPVVLECTEVYLDDKAFYDHSASAEFLVAFPEIMKAPRSLKPTTYSMGNPTETTWDQVLVPYLKAIKFADDADPRVKDSRPGVFISKSFTNRGGDHPVFFLELDLAISNQKVSSCRSHVAEVQQELEAPFLVVLPTNLATDSSSSSIVGEFLEVRVMLSFIQTESLISNSLGALAAECESFEGRLIVFHRKNNEYVKMESKDGISLAEQFIRLSGLDAARISIMDSSEAESLGALAGYPLHPLFHQLQPK